MFLNVFPLLFFEHFSLRKQNQFNFVFSIFCGVIQVVEYILDRNACLLPAYFAVTEIRKLYPEGQLSHWVSVCFVCMCAATVCCHVSNTISLLYFLSYCVNSHLSLCASLSFVASGQFDIRLCG